jgi:hypothetical protein
LQPTSANCPSTLTSRTTHSEDKVEDDRESLRLESVAMDDGRGESVVERDGDEEEADEARRGGGEDGMDEEGLEGDGDEEEEDAQGRPSHRDRVHLEQRFSRTTVPDGRRDERRAGNTKKSIYSVALLLLLPPPPSPPVSPFFTYRHV